MDEASRRQGSVPSKAQSKKQKSRALNTATSSRSLISPVGCQHVQKRDLSASTATGEHLLQGNDLSFSEQPTRRSVFTEAESIWHEDGSKLFSVAVQPTEAQLNTHASFMDMGTNMSIGQTSAQDDKGDEVTGMPGLSASPDRDAHDESNMAADHDENRQHDAGSPEHLPGEKGQAGDRMASRYTRRWDSAPSPSRRVILDDSALEVDQSHLRTIKMRQDRDKKLKTPDAAKLHSRGNHEGISHQGLPELSSNQATWTPKQGRAPYDPALKELGTNPTDIQIAAKQTGFLQRHVSAKAERQHTHNTRLNEDNLSSLEPRKEQRIDPRERILAWIEQGEVHLNLAALPQSSSQELSITQFQTTNHAPTGQASVSTKRDAHTKASKGSQRRNKGTGGGFLECFGCVTGS